MKSVSASFPAMGVDTVAKFTAASAKAMAAAGMKFVVRYLGSLTPGEILAIHAAGLALMVVCYSRKEGWKPTQAMGTADGKKAVADAKALSLPANTTVWCDLEGCSGSVATTFAYVSAWAEVVTAAGFIAGLYVGAGQALGSKELYALPGITRYWHSCSRGVPEPASCGWCMEQLYKPNVKVAGTQVDIDVVRFDFNGRVPTWIVP